MSLDGAVWFRETNQSFLLESIKLWGHLGSWLRFSLVAWGSYLSFSSMSLQMRVK